MHETFHIDPDIRKARTLPSSFYKSHEIFDLIRERIFVKSWHFIGDEGQVNISGSVFPFVLLEGYLDEPVLLNRDEEGILHCMSNVCTHRANLVVLGKGKLKKLTCMYHGRRFNLNGHFEHMPEFKNAFDFPRACDDLKPFRLHQWGPLLFTSLQPAFEFEEILKFMNQRIGFLPMHEFKLDGNLSKEYLVQAHWALYCDNYLEGFHVPFVHDSLNKVLDYGSYTTEIAGNCSLQIGYADEASETFDLPEEHPDKGKNVGAYYYWVFPNLMFNFYPWGLSINVVKPIDLNRTKVSFISYVYRPEKLGKGAGQALDKVEKEDEFVVENVHRGIHSSTYTSGRFSPEREQGVHYFHRLLAQYINP